MGKRHFYRMWLAKTFIKPLLFVDLLAGLLAIIFGAIIYYHPEWGGTMNFLLWSIPLGIFAATIVVGFLLAPYYIYKGVEKKHEDIQSELGQLKNAMPAIRTELKVTDQKFYTIVYNTGGKGADFSANARVVEGSPRKEPYVMHWEGKGGTCHINGKGGYAMIVVAEKSPTRLLIPQQPEFSIYQDEIAAFLWGGTEWQRIPIRTHVGKSVEIHGHKATEFVQENKGIIEVTITSEPPLLEEFGTHLYVLEIDHANRKGLLFTELPVPDTEDSQTE